jgi:hypothetical protein
MTENERHDMADTPTIEVRIYRDDELIDHTLCESDEEATALVARWGEIDDVTCEVDDSSYRHRPDDILTPEPVAPLDEDYPTTAG